MTEPAASLQQLFHEANISNTAARRVVFAALQDSEPLTMQQLLSKCKPSINRASVYRTVGLFERLGVVQRLQIGWKYKLELSNAFQHHHHHLTCLVCGTVIPLPEDSVLEAQLTHLAGEHDFLAQDHQLEIRGTCSNCRA